MVLSLLEKSMTVQNSGRVLPLPENRWLFGILVRFCHHHRKSMVVLNSGRVLPLPENRWWICVFLLNFSSHFLRLLFFLLYLFFLVFLLSFLFIYMHLRVLLRKKNSCVCNAVLQQLLLPPFAIAQDGYHFRILKIFTSNALEMKLALSLPWQQALLLFSGPGN